MNSDNPYEHDAADDADGPDANEPRHDPVPASSPGSTGAQPPRVAAAEIGVTCSQCGAPLSGRRIGEACPGCGVIVGTARGTSGGQVSSGKSTAALVLGICSIVGCFFYGVPALVCGILAIVFSGQVRREVSEGKLDGSVLASANAGRVCGIIGLSLGVLWMLFFVAYIVVVFFMVTNSTNQPNTPFNFPNQPTPLPSPSP